MKAPLVVLAFLLAACSADLATEPSADYACVNSLSPVAYRFIRTDAADTSARVENRYLTPHKWVDTMPMYDTKTGEIAPGFHAYWTADEGRGYCITTLDSLLHHSRGRIASVWPVQ